MFNQPICIMRTLVLRNLLVVVLMAAIIITSSAQESEDKRGNLVSFHSEIIETSNMEEYDLWAKEFKQLADKTGAPDFFVNYNGTSVNYGTVIGKDLSSLDELNKKWSEWFKDNEQATELFKKYGHTVEFTTSSLWRVNPTESYTPEGYDDSIDRPYVRVNKNYLHYGKVSDAKKVIAEYVTEWSKQKISTRTLTAWNVFGEEHACVQFVSWYKNREDWLADRKEVKDKVSEEKLKELNKKFSALVRKEVTLEVWAKPEWGHTNEKE